MILGPLIEVPGKEEAEAERNILDKFEILLEPRKDVQVSRKKGDASDDAAERCLPASAEGARIDEGEELLHGSM